MKKDPCVDCGRGAEFYDENDEPVCECCLEYKADKYDAEREDRNED